MQWLTDNLGLIMTGLLVLSEAAAAITQIFFPNNAGVSGVIAAIIKFLQAFGAKEPGAK